MLRACVNRFVGGKEYIWNTHNSRESDPLVGMINKKGGEGVGQAIAWYLGVALSNQPCTGFGLGPGVFPDHIGYGENDNNTNTS